MQESDQIKQQESSERLNHEYANLQPIKVDNQIISQLFARGELGELAQQCLDASKSVLQPVVLLKNANQYQRDEIFCEDQAPVVILPKIRQIEEVITRNHQLVVEHIMRRRDEKYESKTETIQQRIVRDSSVHHHGAQQQHCQVTQMDHYNQDYNVAQELLMGEYSTNTSNKSLFSSTTTVQQEPPKQCQQQLIDEIDFSILQHFAQGQKMLVETFQQLKQLDHSEQSSTLMQQQNPQQNIPPKSKCAKKTKHQRNVNNQSVDTEEVELPQKLVKTKNSKKSMPSSKSLIMEESLHMSLIGYQSKTETESDHDMDSEDIKFEKQLKLKSLKKSETQEVISNQNNSQSLPKISRPKRSTTNNITYNQQLIGGKGHDHSHYQLVSYQNYKSQIAQPYQIYISIEVLLMLNLHSHLSEYEVIGFLGGFCFESKVSNQKYLLIHSAYPCDSLIANQKERQKNVDLCPISADTARQQIQSRGQQLLGWYHSHPFFPVEPSMIDIRNHGVYQQSFDMENLPFVALIIGPYSVKNRTESLLKIFHLVNENQPFNLNFKQMPSTKLRKSLIQEIKDLFSKYQLHKDTINMKERWSATMTREDKLLGALEMILEKNLSVKDKFNLSQEILKNLSDNDVNQYFSNSTQSQQPSTSASTNNSSAEVCDLRYFNEPVSQPQPTEQLKKNSYFSIEKNEKIEKFMDKVHSMLLKNLYGESSDHEDASEKLKTNDY